MKLYRVCIGAFVFLFLITFLPSIDIKYYILSSNKTPVILFYEPHPNRWFTTFNLSRTCDVDCIFTYNRNYYNESEAVIFFRTLSSNPPKKFLKQKWIYLTFEPPVRQIKFNKHWENAFDWLMSYEKDSQVYVPFGRLRKLPKDAASSLNYQLIYSKKDKDVLWLVSHCSTHSKREEYVKELQKYINVDIYGRCGNKTCPRDSHKDWQAQYNCKDMLSQRYKFYLSFENALCDDYTSEKLYGIYGKNNYMIPVVRGDPNVTRLLPKNTYISTFDFSSVKGLADYLKYIGSSETRYTNFLKAKFQYEVVDWKENYEMAICELCQILHTQRGYSGKRFNLRHRLTTDMCYKPPEYK